MRTPRDYEDASRTAALWGPDPVHPTQAAYRLIAEAIEADLQDPDAKYTNLPKDSLQPAKKSRHDPSRERAGWVDGCSAALPRRDSAPVLTNRGRGAHAPRSSMGPPPRGYNRGRGGARSIQRGSSCSGYRGHAYRGRGGSYWAKLILYIVQTPIVYFLTREFLMYCIVN